MVHLSFCTPAEARTLDTLIKSQVLYQLSYGCNVLCVCSALLLNGGCKGTEFLGNYQILRQLFLIFFEVRGYM